MTVQEPALNPSAIAHPSLNPLVSLVEDETQALLDWAAAVEHSDATYFERGQHLAQRLGAYYRSDGLTEFGFWTPELTAEVIQSERSLELEILTPLQAIDFRASQQTLQFQRDRLAVMQQGEYVWAVVTGLVPGRRDRSGCFYWLHYVDAEGRINYIRDPLAYSLPYGVFAPAEVYDIDRLQQQRADLGYLAHSANFSHAVPPEDDFDDGIVRVAPPSNILQIHVTTASAEGTLEGLTRIYTTISAKLATGEALTPAEMTYTGYEAVQLLPVEPTIEYRREDTNIEHEFFALVEPGNGEAPSTHLTATLRQPHTQNWGYDVPILGSAATNPALLGSLRPDEVVDFIATLHTFSAGPIQVIYDLVYGHADNQALELLTQQFFKGPNMYGQDLNHQLPQVRAILLEMQRRKLNTGADGIRVDGGQDFRFFNPLSGRVEQDDVYLLAMSDLVQNIEGYQRRLFTIYEDGRPWPEPGWEEASTYRELLEVKPGSFQWGPLIFAHNTPTLKGFWDRKWQRVCEVISQGDHWITGCGNHDTVRRGNQIPLDTDINWNLGNTLPAALNRATRLWVYGFSPGLPMDFLNASLETPWGFFRNTDDRYGVKVVSEEVGFLDWEIEPELYRQPHAFPQLKSLGFETLGQLKGFAKALREAIVETDYDLDQVALICQRCLGDGVNPSQCQIAAMEELNEPSLPNFLATLDVPKLKHFAMAFMEDGHVICNVAHYFDSANLDQTHFGLALRQFRQQRPWLRENLAGRDRFNRISDDSQTIFYGHRIEHPLTEEGTTESTVANSNPQEVVMVAHMGGDPIAATLGDWLQLDLGEWEVAVASPGLEAKLDLSDLRAFDLHDGEGLLLINKSDE